MIIKPIYIGMRKMKKIAEVSNCNMQLRTKLTAQIYDAVENYFHKPSNTHIFYCKELSHLGLKGYGDFPNESFEQFQTKVGELIASAPEVVLEEWLQLLKKGAKQRSLEDGNVIKAIVKEELKEILKTEFEELLGRAAAEIIKEQIKLLWDRNSSHSEKTEKLIKESGSEGAQTVSA